MLTWLITGSQGFLGRHLLESLNTTASSSLRLVGLDRDRHGLSSHDAIIADLESFDSVSQVVRSARPDVVFHAAGRTPPANSKTLFRANTLSTINLLRALADLGKPVRVVLVGSAAEVGPVSIAELPVREDHPCRPRGSYALSKWFATYSGLNAPPPLEVVVGRIFNLIGPGLPAGQAFGRFATLLSASHSEGSSLRLKAGNLEARRDFVDVRDASRALAALAVHGQPGTIYNIGTGKSHTIREGLDALVGLSGRRVQVESPLNEGAAADDSVADIGRISRHTDWSPEVTWERSLADLWDEAGRRSRSEPASGGKQVA